MRAHRVAFIAAICLTAACHRPPVGLFPVTARENVEFIRRDGRGLCMDIFTPQGAPSPRPGVLLYHGGGWVAGDRAGERALARFLASMGYTTATASYRLCAKSGPQFPAPIQDAVAALKFFRARAADYELDPARIAVGGESAGGHIALMVGLTQDAALLTDDSLPGISTSVSAIINIYGPTDLTMLYHHGPWFIRELATAFLGGGPDEFADRYRQASPVTHVRRDAPPILTLQGDADFVVPYAQAALLHEAITRAGGSSTLVRVPGGSHGWGASFDGSTNLRTLPAITTFLARAFAVRPGSP